MLRISKSGFTVITCLAALIVLSACGTPVENRVALQTKPHFWQRTDTTSALYMRGPKAQQMLNRDISRCVTELQELDTLGALRNATPSDSNHASGSPEEELSQWETPERDGMLWAEHLEYHDFETCMQAKGWGRMEHVPYKIAEEARKVYTKAILGR